MKTIKHDPIQQNLQISIISKTKISCYRATDYNYSESFEAYGLNIQTFPIISLLVFTYVENN